MISGVIIPRNCLLVIQIHFMRTLIFFIVFIVFLSIYSLANYYLYIRGIQTFVFLQPYKRWYTLFFILVSYSFFAGLILERTASSAFSEWVYRIGSFWLPVMLYLLMAVILIDFLRLIRPVLPVIPKLTPGGLQWLGFSVIALVAMLVVAGHINALSIKVRNISVDIDKPVSGQAQMRILMVSDIHLGALIGERREKHLVDIINEQKPDLVLICGDLIDSEIAPVLRKNLGRHLQEISTPMGIYAITGNHEYIGGIKTSLDYLRSININVLLDTMVVLPNGVQLVGRNDRSAAQGTTRQKPLSELLSTLDRNRPVVVMNHQPYRLEEASEQPVDLHLSGHTHHGQIWPFNYITKAIFEVSWGYLKKGNTHFYVSSGYGTWGPTVRLGNRPEVVIFDIHFKQPQL